MNGKRCVGGVDDFGQWTVGLGLGTAKDLSPKRLISLIPLAMFSSSTTFKDVTCAHQAGLPAQVMHACIPFSSLFSTPRLHHQPQHIAMSGLLIFFVLAVAVALCAASYLFTPRGPNQTYVFLLLPGTKKRKEARCCLSVDFGRNP